MLDTKIGQRTEFIGVCSMTWSVLGDTALSFTLARDGNKAGELPNLDNVVIGAALQAKSIEKRPT
jgi:hypothetical protein